MFSLDAAMKVLKPFYLNPLRGYYLREISRKSSFSYERVHTWTNELEKENVLISARRGKIKEYKLNKSNDLVPKIFAIHDTAKRTSFFEKRQLLMKEVLELKSQLVGQVGEPINCILLPEVGERQRDIEIHILANQELSLPIYNGVERICKKCSRNFNFLIYVDTLAQFRGKWVEDKEYRKKWFNGIKLYGEENFWHEFFRIEGKMETTLFS